MVQERASRVERRLSAILAADVAGYSRLMHHDEEGTHARLTALLADDVAPAITEHGGRVVKNTGDGFLAEFPSAVEALRAGLRIQTRTCKHTIGDAVDRRILFRVGINIGDVIVEPHDIFGDGVNIAARLESIAQPGGICISSSAYDQVRGKVRVEFADLGEQNLKSIGRPVRVYAVISDGPRSAAQAERAGKSLLSPPRLSIVVLPFANLSGEPEQDYFVDGVTESLTTDLSRIGGMAVIARNSAFSYKGRAIDVRQVGRELNVRYVLEGSVQRSGNRLRVNVQLIDAESGRHLGPSVLKARRQPLRYAGRDRIEARPPIGCPTRCSRGTTSGAFPASRCNGPELSRSRLHVQGGDRRALDAGARLFRTCLGNRSPKYPSAGRRGKCRTEYGRLPVSGRPSRALFGSRNTCDQSTFISPGPCRGPLGLGAVQVYEPRGRKA